MQKAFYSVTGEDYNGGEWTYVFEAYEEAQQFIADVDANDWKWRINKLEPITVRGAVADFNECFRTDQEAL